MTTAVGTGGPFLHNALLDSATTFAYITMASKASDSTSLSSRQQWLPKFRIHCRLSGGMLE